MVTFIDSDDYVNVDFLGNFMEVSGPDFVIGGYLSTSGEEIQIVDKWYDRKTIKEFLNHYLNSSLCRTSWGKLMQKSIISDNHIRFDEKIRFGEDTIFIYEYLRHCNSIVTISSCSYNYSVEDNLIHSSCKYRLSLLEIDASLDKVKTLFHLLEKQYGIDCDLTSHYFIFLTMYSVSNLGSADAVVAYRNICQKYMPHLDDASFYCSHFYSPVLRGIMELKCYYIEKRYTEGKALYPILYHISQVAPKEIPFIYKDFYLWYGLIRRKAFFLCDILLRIYSKLRK